MRTAARHRGVCSPPRVSLIGKPGRSPPFRNVVKITDQCQAPEAPAIFFSVGANCGILPPPHMSVGGMRHLVNVILERNTVLHFLGISPKSRKAP